MERIWESFGVEIERDHSEKGEHGSGMGLKMKKTVLKTIWATLTMLDPTDSVDRTFSVDRFWVVLKNNQKLEKNQEKYPRALKNFKNSKENLVKFSASDSISRYI